MIGNIHTEQFFLLILASPLDHLHASDSLTTSVKRQQQKNHCHYDDIPLPDVKPLPL